MKQQCHVGMLYLSWALFVGIAAALAIIGRYILTAVWLVGVPVAMWAYISIFPRISPYLGFGTVEDERPARLGAARSGVTFYSAVWCPFCPVVEQRLKSLQQRMVFTLDKVDITLKPKLVADKKIQALPVVEVGDQRITGTATSSQLAALIASVSQARGASRKG